MAKLFGTNGVRGVFGEDLTLDFISKITLSLASFFKKGPILVGYDGRESSIIISKVVTAALSSSGIDSAVCGIVPTPCLQFATRQLGYNGGIMITASHNPPQYNGLKVIAKDGIEISREDELKVEEFYFAKKWKFSDKFGSISKESNAVNTYISGIKDRVDVRKIKSQNLKIVGGSELCRSASGAAFTREGQKMTRNRRARRFCSVCATESKGVNFQNRQA